MATKHRQSVIVTKDEDSYIPEYTLDRIESEVCTNIPGMEYTQWEDAINMCVEIEREPLDIYRCLNTIVTIYGIWDKEPQTINDRMKSILLRIHILLYYRHRDDRIYEISVFPPLREYVNRYVNCKNYNFHVKIYDPLNKIIDLEREVRELQKRSCENMMEEGCEEIEWHDKVRLELALKFIEKAGANLKKYGNKTKVANILQTITKLPLSTCKNYVTNRDLNTKEHNNEILKVNATLQEVGIDIRL